MSDEITLNTVHAEIKTLSINMDGIARLVTQHEKRLADSDDWQRLRERAEDKAEGYAEAIGTVGISKRQLAAVSAISGVAFGMVATIASLVVQIFVR